MNATATKLKTPAGAITRVLRALGLAQGVDFHVQTVKLRGQKAGVRVSLGTMNANRVVTASVEAIEHETAALGWPFYVEEYTTRSGQSLPSVFHRF